MLNVECYLLLKEANICINLICFDRYFDHPHSNGSPLSPFLPQKHCFFGEKVFDMCPLLGLSSLVKIAALFKKIVT